MRWTNFGFTPESAPRTAAGWEGFFPARLLFWVVRSSPSVHWPTLTCRPDIPGQSRTSKELPLEPVSQH